MMDGDDVVVTNPFVMISIGMGRLERDGAMIVDGDDDVMITSLYDAVDVTYGINGGKLSGGRDVMIS